MQIAGGWAHISLDYCRIFAFIHLFLLSQSTVNVKWATISESLLCVHLLTLSTCRNDLCVMVSATRWHCTPPYWKFSAPQKSCHGKSSSCRATLCDFSSWRVAFRKLERTLLSKMFFLFDTWLLMLLFLLSITNPIWHLLYPKVFKTPEFSKTNRIQSVPRPTVFLWQWFYYIYNRL